MPAVNRSAMEIRPPPRDRVDDHIVRGRDHQRDDRGDDRDVDGVVAAIAAGLHLRNHQPADGGGVGRGGAGDAAEEERGRDVHLAQPAAEMPDEGPRERDQPARDVAAHHQLAREDEERDRHQREDRDARVQALEHHHRRQAHVEHRGEGGGAEAEGDRRADEEEDGEDAEQDPQLHRQASAVSAASPKRGVGRPAARRTRRSAQNRTTRTPPPTSGMKSTAAETPSEGSVIAEAESASWPP
jgi:hypothetical protein